MIVSPVHPNAPNGFLRKIDNIVSEDDRLIVSTSPAALGEAIEQCGIHEIVPIVFAEPDNTGRTLRGGRDIDVTLSGNKMTIGESIEFFADSSAVKLEVQAELTPRLEIALRIENGEIKHFLFKLVFDIGLKGGFGIGADTDVLKYITDPQLLDRLSWLNKSGEIPVPINISPIIITISGVPVVVKPMLSLAWGIQFKAYGSGSISAEKRGSFEAGFLYDDDGFKPIGGINAKPVELGINAKWGLKLKPYIGPKILFVFYEAAGPFVMCDIFLEADGNIKSEAVYSDDSMTIKGKLKVCCSKGVECVLGFDTSPKGKEILKILFGDRFITFFKKWVLFSKKEEIFCLPEFDIFEIGIPADRTPDSLPDLVCSGITIPSEIRKGTDCTFTVTVSNTGPVYTGGVNVDWYIDGRFMKQTTIASVVPPYGSQSIQYTWPASSGTHIVHADIDPDNIIAESDDTNNSCSEYTFTVDGGGGDTTPLPDLFCSEITLPAHMKAGESHTFTAAVSNTGREYTGGVCVRWYIDRQTVTDTRINTAIAPGGFQTTSCTRETAPGPHVISVVIDPDNAIAESDETNNAGPEREFIVDYTGSVTTTTIPGEPQSWSFDWVSTGSSGMQSAHSQTVTAGSSVTVTTITEWTIYTGSGPSYAFDHWSVSNAKASDPASPSTTITGFTGDASAVPVYTETHPTAAPTPKPTGTTLPASTPIPGPTSIPTSLPVYVPTDTPSPTPAPEPTGTTLPASTAIPTSLPVYFPTDAATPTTTPGPVIGTRI
ncbi:MAG: hypothetical protein JW881_03380 [Spirochaetales bacterium]|nr:hypothetical protein [Spirochaetales bacterium]